MNALKSVARTQRVNSIIDTDKDQLLMPLFGIKLLVGLPLL